MVTTVKMFGRDGYITVVIYPAVWQQSTRPVSE